MSCWCDGEDPGCSACHPSMSDEDRAQVRQQRAIYLRALAAKLDDAAGTPDPRGPYSDALPGLWTDEPYRRPTAVSRLSLKVLPQIWGRQWDVRAMNLIDALQPTFVLVSMGELKTDARWGRVTVMLDSAGLGIIKWIEQDVTVGLRGGFEHGHDYEVRYLRAPQFDPAFKLDPTKLRR
jgi:hypothetical protein